MNVNAKKIEALKEKTAKFQEMLAEARAEDEKIKAMLTGFEASVDELQAGVDAAQAELDDVTAELTEIDATIEKVFG